MYAKLMSRITESSLMEEEVLVRYAFMMLLAIADPKGYVIGTDVAIARRLNISISDFKRAVTELGRPDPDSNSQEHEGRRVLPSDGERGYWIVNYRKYRETRDEEQRREYMKDYMRKRRNGSDVAALTPGKQVKTELAHAEGEEEGEAKAEKRVRKDRATLAEIQTFCTDEGLPDSDAKACFYKWEGNGWTNGGKPIKCWKSTIRSWRESNHLPSQKPNANTARPTAQNPRTSGTLNGQPGRYATGPGVLGGKRHEATGGVPGGGPSPAKDAGGDGTLPL